MKKISLIILLHLFALSAQADPFSFFQIESMKYEEAVSKCEEQGARLATLVELREAIAEEKIRPKLETTYWVTPDLTTSMQLTGTLMTAGISRATSKNTLRGLVTVNRYGMPEHHTVYLCSQALEEGEKECKSLERQYHGSFASYCVRSEREPASQKKRK